MTKKIVRAIIFVEINEEDEGSSSLSCKLDDGRLITLSRSQLLVPPKSSNQDDIIDCEKNIRVTC